MDNKYEIVMGLEVHVELATKAKLFCSCSTRFGSDPNENVCSGCGGLPGPIPITNKRAIELAIIAATLTNGKIAQLTTFDKKSYFYPDLSTGFQVTQWFAPISKGGFVEIGTKKITLKQIHIEEDAGKLVHDARGDSSFVDYNRAAVPLIEIVSNPDFRTADEVIAYLTKLQKLLSFAKVSDCKMQEGSLRCDVNISVRKYGETAYGVRTEVKNMNSFKAVRRAIAYESERHIDAIETGREQLIQETRGWDDAKGVTYSMRSKENAQDYRYFPNADIPPIHIDDAWLSEIQATILETAESKFKRFSEEYLLTETECNILTENVHITTIFEKVVEYNVAPKEAANWIIADFFGIIKASSAADTTGTTGTSGASIENINIDCEQFAAIITLAKENKINRTIGRDLLQKLISGEISDVKKFVKENNLGISVTNDQLETIVAEILSQNPKAVQEYKSGNEKVLAFLVGQVMRKTAGKANAKSVNEVVLEQLKSK